ncbi:hypothetical protein CBR_g4122 [Chara braunii]|uniref:DUF659 domain-containing protein n=1 Tax=Chara braunii TaxID=69332 RepID=A0A388KHE4_CHABU|nr:hypothetical protein CBR_g4122 [Chara braunii]|eukprot:GBG69428.1 hypothetical protein CBR_g4122 [Chara braunii]
MTKHAEQPVKKHFEAVKAYGAADKGNKVWRCKYCNHNRTGIASRLRDHFLKGACNVPRLRGTISKEELLRREQGRDAAISELGGVLTGAGAEVDLSSSEDEIDTEDAVTTGALTKSSTTHVRQTKIVDNAIIITANEQTQRTVGDWMTVECVPFNMMRSMYWDHMVKALMNAPKSFQYAKFDEVRTKRVAVRKDGAAAQGMARQRLHVATQWRREKGAKTYFDILSTAIRKIGEEAVVGVVMDNAATCAAAGRMVEAEFKHIFSVSCTAHSIDLMLEQFGKIGWVDVVLKKSAEVVKFFMNHSRVRDLLLVNSQGAILTRPGATRFATNFIMLDSVQDLYLPLQTCLTDKDWKDSIVLPEQRHLFVVATETILDNDFWAGVEKVQKTSEKLLQLLKLSDVVGPTMSKIYGGMDAAVESLRNEECFTEMEKEELQEILMRRWNTMTSPLHCAAMFLDPEFRNSNLEKDLEVMDGLWTWVYSWAKPTEYKELDDEVNCWIEGTGKFRSEREWRAKLRGDREEAEDCEDEDDDDDDGARDHVAKASTIARQRATNSLLELERELNKELPSWRKAIRPSKYLARLHLQESQHAGKTMTFEHAEKYINARAQACAPNVKAPAKRPPGRPREVAHVQGTEADEE